MKHIPKMPSIYRVKMEIIEVNCSSFHLDNHSLDELAFHVNTKSFSAGRIQPLLKNSIGNGVQ